ncbi:MAG: ImmA/IrrE family metallo-endopeptidase [Phycisphaerales bacterium]
MRRVERAAWDVVVRCMRSEGRTALPIPVPVERWVEGPLGVRLAVTDFGDAEDIILGAAFTRANEIRINESLSDHEERWRFTLAHELGHLVLHGKVADEFRDGARLEELVEARVEREANRFAGALLAPLPALTALLGEELPDGNRPITTVAAMEGPDAARAASRVKSMVVPALAKRLCMSRSAVVLRLVDLRFPGGRPVVPVALVPELLRG